MRADEATLRRFVTDTVGGEVVRFERTATGSSRLTFLVDVRDGEGDVRALVLRCDSGDGPLSGTGIDLAHEAVFYRALADQPVRIPELVGEASDGSALLMERAPGTESLAGLPDAQRGAVEADFGRALAELHAVDAARLPLPGVARPADVAGHALLDLRRWAGFLHARVPQPSELSRFAIDWLERHPPGHVDRTVLCHGDAGVGNFLHDGARVTALLDWEFAHLGDPLDDVAWVTVRSHVTGGDGMPGALAAWREHADLPLDAGRIATFRVLVLLRMAISCEIALANAGGPGAMDTTTYQLLLPYLGLLLPQALREAGCEGAALDRLEEHGTRAVAEHPVLAAAARPLPRFEAPA